MLTIARARENLQVREMLADQFGGLHRGLDVVDGQHEHLGILRMRGAQQFQARCVAVKYLVAEAAQKIDLSLIGLEGCEGDLLGEQDASHDLAESAEARDDDLRIQFDGRVVGAASGSFGLKVTSYSASSTGLKIIEAVTTSTSSSAVSLSMMPSVAARPNSTKANSPPDGRLMARPRLAAGRQSRQPADAPQNNHLQHHETQGQTDDQKGLFANQSPDSPTCRR